MRGRLLLITLWVSACASAPAPVARVTVIEDPDEPRVYRLPPRVQDVICEQPNLPGTCATVGEVRAFLRSRKS